MKLFLIPYIFCIFLSIFVCVIVIFEKGYSITNSNSSSYLFVKSYEYQWPVIGYNKVTSFYGKRDAPVNGSSTFHTGIDIAAPTGTTIVSSIEGYIVYTGFKGAGGHTIIIKNDEVEVSYCHVDSKYYPVLNSYVLKGQAIGKVGPKNIYDVIDNPYKDKKGNPTNGATTGPHLHFSIKINNKFIDPLGINE